MSGSRAKRDAGESLPESVITIIIMSFVAVGIAVMFTTLVGAAAEYRTAGSIDAVLHNDVAEITAQVQDGTSPLYALCATPTTYTIGANAVSFGNEISGFTSTVTSVTYWNGTSFSSSCPPLPAFPGPQQITVKVTGANSSQNGSASVTVDNPYTPENPPYDANLAQLAFIQQPTTITSLTPFSPAVQVAVEDASGNILTNDWSNLTLTVQPIAFTNGGALVNCTGTETLGVFTFPNCTLGGGGQYELVAHDQSVTGTSQVFNSIDQLDTPVVTSAAQSATNIGTVVATYTPSANAPDGQIYTGLACLDPVTLRDCATVTPFVSGQGIGGLDPGQQYYVAVEANGSTDYLDAKSLGVGPVTATLQAQAPYIASVTAPGGDALNVVFSEASSAPNPTFVAEACLTAAMSQGCVTDNNFVSGSNITGLMADTSYYVTIAMNGQANYIGATSPPYGPIVATSATTVTFSANGGTGTMSNETEGFGVAAPLTPNAFTPPLNGTFTGWNTASNGSGTAYADGATYPFTSSTTLYAQWNIVAAPGAPTNVVATAGNAKATIVWSAPTSTGGSPITGYTVTATDTTTTANGGQTCVTTGATSCTITGLTNGDTYTFAVVATNSVGTSPASLPSSAVIPMTVPDPPTNVSAVATNGSVTVKWSAPVNNGGSPITGYTVTATDTTTTANGGQTCVTTGATSCTITGLTNGDTYTFAVVATNINGNSLPSSSVASSSVPGAPTGLSATGADNSMTFIESWSAPASNGGAVITDYIARYSTDGATWTVVDTSSSALSYALTVSSQTTYYVQIAAVNAAGQGAWSASDTVNWVVTGSYPIYTYEQTGSYPIYTYEVTGSYPIYTYEVTGSYPIYTYEQIGTTPVYGYVCTSWAYPDGIKTCTGTTYEQTGSTPVYGNVQTGTGYTYGNVQTGTGYNYGFRG